MKALTPRQLNRHRHILYAAPQMIADHGCGDMVISWYRMLIEGAFQSFEESLKVMHQGELHADADIRTLAVRHSRVSWTAFFMRNKAVLQLWELKKTLLGSFLTGLISYINRGR